MTGKADFTEDEWKLVLEAPPSAGLIVIASDRGGSVRESFSMAKAYTEARKEHGESELLDEIVTREARDGPHPIPLARGAQGGTLGHLRDAVALLKEKATPEEVDEYKKFIVGLANRVAEARKEGFMGLSGDRVSDDEKTAIQEIEGALG